MKFGLHFVNIIQLTNGRRLCVTSCEGLNYNQGVPDSYGVTRLDGKHLIIPRNAVLWFEQMDEAAA
jgi:hypothetical protein